MKIENEKPPTLPSKERTILRLLIDKGELYGLQLVEESDGELKRGTVYVTLARLEEKGYIESHQEELGPGAIGLPRRLYRPTGLGQQVLAAWEIFRSVLIPAVQI